MNFGSQLKKIRIEAGYTQLELAKLCNVDRKTISRIENNTHALNINVLVLICKELGVSPSQILEKGE